MANPRKVNSVYTEFMKLLLTVLVLCLLLATSALPQTALPPPQQALSQVRQFLGLTDDQVTAILQNNQAYNEFSFQQQQTIQHAQSQIAVETAQDPLDPIALGTLYAGIESACRELRGQAATTQKQNISVLSDAQKVKLNMLNDAIKLAPIISEAQSGNLLGSPTSPPFAFGGFAIGGFTTLIGFPQGVSGCASPFPANIISLPAIGPVATGTSQPGVTEMTGTATPKTGLLNPFYGTIPKPAPRQ